MVKTWVKCREDLEPSAYFNQYLIGGIPTPLKNDGVKVSWDDEIPNIMGKS